MDIPGETVQAIGKRIRLEARQEHLAIRMMKEIERSRFLFDYAPEHVEEFGRIVADEARHLRLFLDCAKRYASSEPSDVADLSVALTYPPWVQLRHIYAVEQMSWYGFRLNIEIHQTLTGDQDAVAMYRMIAQDERRHVAFGRKVHSQLLKVPRFLGDFMKLQKLHVVENAYRDTFGARSLIRRQFGLEPQVGKTTIPAWPEEC